MAETENEHAWFFGASLLVETKITMASSKRHLPYEEDEVSTHPKKPREYVSESLISPHVVLNSADCDLGIQNPPCHLHEFNFLTLLCFDLKN